MPRNLIFLLLPILLLACDRQTEAGSSSKLSETHQEPPPSPRTSPYSNFNSVAALDRAEAYETEYFDNYRDGVSASFGRVWADQAMLDSVPGEGGSTFDTYKAELVSLGKERDSLDCTLYAQELLRVGMGPEQYEKLDSLHREIWGDREYAGWSVGYLLTQHFDWKAYLILDPVSVEYKKCTRQFGKDRKYPVWKQPNIPLEAMYVIGESDSLIEALLQGQEFGWGFSEQGIHTWVMHYSELKECNWAGAPGWKYDIPGAKTALYYHSIH